MIISNQQTGLITISEPFRNELPQRGPPTHGPSDLPRSSWHARKPADLTDAEHPFLIGPGDGDANRPSRPIARARAGERQLVACRVSKRVRVRPKRKVKGACCRNRGLFLG